MKFQKLDFTDEMINFKHALKATQLTNLEDVKTFMTANGFKNTKNHDYRHPQLGIILEDLHDENVLTQNDILYFIDTVFYLVPEIFW